MITEVESLRKRLFKKALQLSGIFLYGQYGALASKDSQNFTFSRQSSIVVAESFPGRRCTSLLCCDSISHDNLNLWFERRLL